MQCTIILIHYKSYLILNIMIKIENCSFRYKRGKDFTIENLNLTFNEGGVYGLLGENGVGKSTLLQLICGLLTPETGCVLLKDVNTRLRLPSSISNIYFVPEEIELPNMKLWEFAKLYGALYPNYSEDDMKRNISQFKIIGNPNLKKLSMGQKKKIALSFAMACNTPVLIMDEPTNGLDIPGKSTFRKFIAETMTDERIFIISTHQVRDVSNILDHVIIMNNSKVLLNNSIYNIQSTLRFLNTIDQKIIDQAAYVIPGIGGSAVAIPSEGEENLTDVNLEILFDFAINSSEKLNSILNNDNGK